MLADLFDSHFLNKSKVVAAVAGEVVRNATLVLPPIGPHQKRHLHKSAKVVRGRYKELLASATPSPSPVPTLLASVKAELTVSGKLKLKAGQTLHANANDGEAESIYWAATGSIDVITNDGDAHLLAEKHHVSSSTFVEVARHMVMSQKLVGRHAIFRELMTLSNRSIFPGEHITSELDLV
ncbi:hypothetical protein ABIE21_000485 [Conyzicola nivalis]|uniref:Cyclic nucleotide-binding domain-containing protein n=1 Tax=Conyzicola nivalis TaxID=1477021 RepID=A0ABV2QK62_9MICO